MFKKIKIGLVMIFAIVFILNIGLITEKTCVHIADVYNKAENVFGQSAVAQSEPLVLPIIQGENVNLYGMGTTAGSGRHLGTPDTTIYKVTNLNDAGPGSLREGIRNAITPITIIFEVSGTIQLDSDIGLIKSYVTIAGQTAPSPGITVAGGYLKIERNCHDILIQHIRFRRGEANLVEEDFEMWDALIFDNHYSEAQGWTPPWNVVIDHCSFSWAIDENIEIGGDNVTFIDCIISEGINDGIHPKGKHSKGLVVTANNDGVAGGHYTAIIRNLFAHNGDRNPFITAGKVVIANNVVYDHWYGITTYDGEGGKGSIQVSVVGNYLYQTDSEKYCIYFQAGFLSDTRIYFANDNYYSGAVQTNPWDSESTTCFQQRRISYETTSDVPIANRASTAVDAVWPVGYTAMSAADARDYVLVNAGARPADRDAVDIRIIDEIITGVTTDGLIDSVEITNADCVGVDNPIGCCDGIGVGTCYTAPGGWPILAENTRTLTIPSNPHEIQSSGYTNLEEWLHSYLEEVEGETTDLTPPILSNSSPSNTLPINTTQTNISLTTNENATCKYSLTPNTIYDEMTNTFTTTGGTTHSTTVTGLSNGQSYDYYVRCIDTANNFNTTDFNISFSVASSVITYNISNFIQLLTDWLSSISLTADLNNDGIVNTRDLGIMMSGWEG